ncbi:MULTISPECIES: hypothetical protein [unclassified Wolbachia]|uniref:hypothetical protein n=1 Tax=unclassified Wolbachia TaxID=2640676 RepID=UPI0021F8867A|nr:MULTISPECIES: hypothetical protein [unclassified Wolbachia]
MPDIMRGVRWEHREVDNSCKGLCTKTFLESRIGHSKFDPSLGKYPEVSLSELEARCKARCDNPNIQFDSSSPLLESDILGF